MTKKSAKILFTILSSLFNAFISLLTIAVFCLLAYVIMNFGFKVKNASAYMLVWSICFVGGMICGLFIYLKLMNLIIKKTKLSEILK
jgi:Na+/H+-dicarboxylate symporter